MMIKAVRKASRNLIRDFNEVGQLQVSCKGTGGFASIADKRTEELLYNELHQIRPTYHFLMEERGEVLGETNCEYRFIIDPLDGTVNFLHGLPYFSISVALEHLLPNGKSEIIACVTEAPILKETFWAEKGKGAWFEDAMGNRRRLRVSGRKDFPEALLFAGSLKKDMKLMEPLQAQVAGIRSIGSTTLALAYLAAGQMDGFIQSHAQIWDMAAGILLIKEAGGVVRDIQHGDNMFETKSIIAANNLLIHKLQLTS